MVDPCDVCGSDRIEAGLSLSLCGVYDANVARCQTCGFRQIRPRLTREQIAALYPDEYFDPASGFGFTDYARKQQHYERDARFLARTLRGITAEGRLLEVGCGVGFLMDALARYTRWCLIGVDVSPMAAQYAREVYGLDVRCGTLEEASFSGEYFDFVVQKDVIEHVAHPRRHLLETHRILRPGGYLLVVTPNGDSNLRPLEALSAKLPLDRLPLLTQGHLSFFRLKHLERLFRECGFQCLRARSIGVRRGLRALGHIPFRKVHPPDAQRRGTTSPPPFRSESGLEAVRTRMKEAIRQRQTRFRTSLPYAGYRRTLERLDSLPARLEVGNDFEFLLRKRA
jgi:2-polyprenyl-3-methyl-5-hydroxy-6-metoxy-1,4-benzoquinol methylase